MDTWTVDEGLQTLIDEWKKANPGAVVYTIADDKHSQNPDVSQHAKDRGGSKPGDTKGEIDAGDFMPGKGGVTQVKLNDLFEGLHKSRDKRILYVIYGNKIFSSVTRPWVIRDYAGKFHSHVHVSVNDNFKNNQSDWEWEKMAARELKYVPVEDAKLPEKLMRGDDDSARDGWNHVGRTQALLNFMAPTAPLDLDGFYGKLTAAKAAKVFGGNGNTINLEQLRRLHGI